MASIKKKSTVKKKASSRPRANIPAQLRQSRSTTKKRKAGNPGATFFVRQVDESKWCCMELLGDDTLFEHVCFDSEERALSHFRRHHSPTRAEGVGSNKIAAERSLDARPDTLDFRDKMYNTSLMEVPVEVPLENYFSYEVPVLDQGTEGACTGYGLATVANYLLRRRKVYPDPTQVSAKMLYQMAKRYDEWAGENYSGSSARGAMKGWHKHGLCKRELWEHNSRVNYFNEARTSDAVKRPLGSYYRVNHKDVVAMHSAMAEVGILYATANVHDGWSEVGGDGIIPFLQTGSGGHAFAIVAYDTRGFWIQNSWGETWGYKGMGLISYDDWLQNGSDVWVARLGAPVRLVKTESTAIAHADAARRSNSYSFQDLRPHIVSLGNDGELQPGGEYGTDASDVRDIFRNDFPRVTEKWAKKRLLLYAHGGLVSEATAVQRLADYRNALLDAEVYPISLIWHSDAWTTITNILKDAVKRRRPEGFLDDAKDFMLDRLDDALELLARPLTGRLQWKEMKENALGATKSPRGGLRTVLPLIKELADKYKNDFEIHLIGHSAGSILLAPLIAEIGAVLGKKNVIGSCTLWAPACTTDLFKQFYVPAIEKGKIERFATFNLTDEAELDDHCAGLYNKSLLYLVSNAFERHQRNPFSRYKYSTPILGIQRCIQDDPELRALFKAQNVNLILAPNSPGSTSDRHSTCSTHGGFDDDLATVESTLARILNVRSVSADIDFKRSASSTRDRRQVLNRDASK